MDGEEGAEAVVTRTNGMAGAPRGDGKARGGAAARTERGGSMTRWTKAETFPTPTSFIRQ